MTSPHAGGPRAALKSLLFWCLSGATAFALDATTTLGVSWDKNFSRTSAAPYQADAVVWDASVSLGQHWSLNGNWLLSVAGGVQAEFVPEYTGMNFTSAGPDLALRRKFGLGPLAPVLTLSAGLAAVDFQENGRSGTRLTAGLRLAKRLNEAWRLGVEAGRDQFDARHSPFDTRNHRVQVDATWDMTGRWQAGFGASRLWGTETANAPWSVYGQALNGVLGPEVEEYYRAAPWEVSNTFGPGWVAYRVDCHADMWWLSLSPALSPDTSLPLRYQSVNLVNEAGIRYRSEFWSLSLVHRF